MQGSGGYLASEKVGSGYYPQHYCCYYTNYYCVTVQGSGGYLASEKVGSGYYPQHYDCYYTNITFVYCRVLVATWPVRRWGAVTTPRITAATTPTITVYCAGFWWLPGQ